MSTAWSKLHQTYKLQDWITKPSQFAETAINYFPDGGNILELGAGLGQDGRYFALNAYEVTCTDLEAAALTDLHEELPEMVRHRVHYQQVDLRQPLPFTDGAFDVIYAHLSLHYFDHATTESIFQEIYRVLNENGILAFFVNSTSDPQYGTGEKLEDDYFYVEDKPKRFFSVDAARSYTKRFEPIILDDQGETFKDSAKGVHNLIRFIGSKIPPQA